MYKYTQKRSMDVGVGVVIHLKKVYGHRCISGCIDTPLNTPTPKKKCRHAWNRTRHKNNQQVRVRFAVTNSYLISVRFALFRQMLNLPCQFNG